MRWLALVLVYSTITLMAAVFILLTIALWLTRDLPPEGPR